MGASSESWIGGFTPENKRKLLNGALFAVLCLITVVQVFPLWYLAVFSLKSNDQIYGGNIIGLPTKWIWSNYSKALIDAKIILFFANSLMITGATIVVTVALSAMVSYAIMRLKWRLSKIVLGLFLLGLMIPQHSALLPLFVILKNLHLLNTYFALILPYVAFALSIAVLVLTGFLETIPKELEEAAFIDGCSIYRVFFSIIMPLLAPALATVGILTYLSAYNEMMFAVTYISTERLKTLTVGILGFQGRYTTNWGTIGASLVVAVIPTVVIYLLLSNQVQKGLTAGALKG
jgi:raffinose/stachyose/melibiose transport system permease protein